jgi:hypothetical protein
MNIQVKILGTVHLILGGGGMLVCMAAYLCWLQIASDAHSLRTAHTLGQMMFMFSVFVLLPSLICGLGLLFNTSWGRVATIVWSLPLLLVIPIGTLLGSYGLWLLLARKKSRAQALAQTVQAQQNLNPHAMPPREWLCEHLLPVEQMLRNDGIEVTCKRWQDRTAVCQVDLPRLTQRFGPIIAALYAERHEIDRSYLDPKSALFWCAACGSQLRVVHRDSATESTPWFPKNTQQACANTDCAE